MKWSNETGQFVDEVTLQGAVESFSLTISDVSDDTVELPADAVSYMFEDLTPNTNYTFTIKVTVYGGLSMTSLPATGRTADGGMCYHYCLCVYWFSLA